MALRAHFLHRGTRRWLGGAFLLFGVGLLAFTDPLGSQQSWGLPAKTVAKNEPISPLPLPASGDPRRVALGARLFADSRLSRNNSRSCASCHDVRDNGATRNALDRSLDGTSLRLNTLTVFNAAASFRLSWTGKDRSFEEQAKRSIENPHIMGSTVSEVVGKLGIDPDMRRLFELAYGRAPDEAVVLDAIAAYERSLLTPGSRFDRWLQGDGGALSATELHGYQLFKSLGCVSCHQGVNIGGNLLERHGIFHPLGSPEPVILRVPSLRNVDTTPPYFHDGSAGTLEEAVERMGYAQLNTLLQPDEVHDIVAFLRTLTGNFNGHPVGQPQ
ncbi:cytochrome-c peroxidase [Dongia sedimenti]|uniref:Cytochrome c peroxidase n=1 Tax=Dongia sedimenti TaxID=3064282 RepID=A0ABU0YTS6_9PROT|nr:cytochrome c peroxidase [Rhodospirillaceae bacterium R-7]